MATMEMTVLKATNTIITFQMICNFFFCMLG